MESVPHWRATPAALVYLDTIIISNAGVSLMGHFSEISNSRVYCSAVRSPSSSIRLSIRSAFPSLVSHSAQSLAWIFSCRRSTEARVSGQPFPPCGQHDRRVHSGPQGGEQQAIRIGPCPALTRLIRLIRKEPVRAGLDLLLEVLR